MTQLATPAWLLEHEPAMCPCGCVGRRRRASFVARTLAAASGVLRQALYSEDVTTGRGLLQRLDPRVKLLTTLGLLLVAALAHHLPVLLAMYAGTLALAAASGLPLGGFVKRVWLFIPLFTGIVVLPATFSFVTPGQVVLPLWQWHGQPVGLTRQGLAGAALVTSRVATSISLVVLLTLTTPWTRLLAALRALAVPRIFVLVVGMAYRYLFLLLGAVGDMFEARTARTVAPEADSRAGRRFVASAAGTLFARSYALSEEVHQAMVARGYRGEARTLERLRLSRADLLWVLGCVAAAAALLGWDRLLAR